MTVTKPTIRIFTSFQVNDEWLSKLLPSKFPKKSADVKINESGQCDYALIFGFAPLGSWVESRKGSIAKVVVEPWHKGLFYRYVRKHSKFFSYVFSPHTDFDKDQRLIPWAGNADWHIMESWDHLASLSTNRQSSGVSMIMSEKRDLPGHIDRVEFANSLMSKSFLIKRFGRGTSNPVENKDEALKDFAYSIAIENSQQANYFTEKFYDCLLSWTVPIYRGATNIGNFFPPESFIYLPDDTQAASELLLGITKDGKDYESRIAAMGEARKKILHNYTLYALLTEFMEISSPKGAWSRTSLDNLDSWIFSVRDSIFELKNRLGRRIGHGKSSRS